MFKNCCNYKSVKGDQRYNFYNFLPLLTLHLVVPSVTIDLLGNPPTICITVLETFAIEIHGHYFTKIIYTRF